MKPIGYVELPSYEVIDSAANALDNISVAIAEEVESRKEKAIEQYRKRWFSKDRTDDECYQKYCDLYLIDESIDEFVKWRFSNISNLIKKVLQSAKSTDKVLLSIETHNILLNWASKNEN